MVISVKMRPAPPKARAPRCTRCQSSGMPSSAEYMHMGESTTRFARIHVAQPERLEHRWNVRAPDGQSPLLLLVREIARHRLDEFRRAHGKIVIGDGFRPRHQAEGELDRIVVPEASKMFEPDQGDIGGVLGLLDILAPVALEGRQCRSYVIAMLAESLEQGDRVFHGKLGARADGKMRCRLGVADQNDIVLHPALVADHGEVAPQRAVGDQGWPSNSCGKDTFQKSCATRFHSSPPARPATRSRDRSRSPRSNVPAHTGSNGR